MERAFQIDEGDNVATVTSKVSPGEDVEVFSPEGNIVLRPKALKAIPFGHKIALADIDRGEVVVKYGEIIGVASRPIRFGDWVHTHNVESSAIPTDPLREEQL